MTNAIFGVLEALGLDEDELDWRDLNLCNGQPTSKFYEEYESSPRTAEVVDQMCLSCPVRTQCLQSGVENKEWGVWGGIYLVNGKPDENKNAHKTPDIWNEIREGLS